MDAGSTRQQASGINGIQMLYRSERGGIKKKRGIVLHTRWRIRRSGQLYGESSVNNKAKSGAQAKIMRFSQSRFPLHV